MEKADILDMTVKYLKLMRARKGGSPGQESATFAVGYRACATEVARHLASTTMPEDVKSRLLTSISYKTASPPVVPCPTHVIGYHGDYTNTPPGWRGMPTHAAGYPHHVTPPHYPGQGGVGGTPLRGHPVSIQPRDFNMNIVDMVSANPTTTTTTTRATTPTRSPLDNERYQPRRNASETVSSSTSRDNNNAAFAQPLQLNVSLNFGGHGRSPPTGANPDPKEDSDDMWRPW